MCTVEMVPVSIGRGREGVHRQSGWVFGQELAVAVVKGGGHDVPFRPERGENFTRILFVAEGYRGGAVGGDDLAEGRELAADGLSEREVFIGKVRRARQQHHRAARQQEQDSQLPLDGCPREGHGYFFEAVTTSA